MELATQYAELLKLHTNLRNDQQQIDSSQKWAYGAAWNVELNRFYYKRAVHQLVLMGRDCSDRALARLCAEGSDSDEDEDRGDPCLGLEVRMSKAASGDDERCEAASELIRYTSRQMRIIGRGLRETLQDIAAAEQRFNTCFARGRVVIAAIKATTTFMPASTPSIPVPSKQIEVVVSSSYPTA